MNAGQLRGLRDVASRQKDRGGHTGLPIRPEEGVLDRRALLAAGDHVGAAGLSSTATALPSETPAASV